MNETDVHDAARWEQNDEDLGALLALVDELTGDRGPSDSSVVAGETGQAQENRAVRGAAAAMSRTRTIEMRELLRGVRERNAELRRSARTAHDTASTAAGVGRTARRADLAGVLDRAARALVTPDPEDVDATLAHIVEGAVATVPAVRWAGISLVRRGEPLESKAPSSDLVRDLDRLQSELDQGPCVDAIWTQDRVLVEDMSQATDRWPEFAAAATRHGVLCSVSYQLFAARGSAGALNLYADTPRAFDDEALDLSALFASQAAIALHGAQRAAQLTTALRSRDVIGQAKGILIERFHLDEDRAFALLVQSSQDTNMKLVEVARWLLEESTTASRPGDAR